MKTDRTFKKLRNEIDNMLADINGATERNIMLIEDKIRTMGNLIDRGSKLISVLKKEKEKQELSINVYRELGRSKPLNIMLEKSEPPSDKNQIDNQELDTIETAGSKHHGFQSLSIQERVLVLFRKGKSVEQIASILGISHGEAELIISIHDKRD